MPDIVARKDALRLGLSQYFTGKACKAGHVAPRFTLAGDCAECRLAYQRDRRKRERETFNRARGG